MPIIVLFVPFLLPVILQRNIRWLLIVLSIAVVCIDVKHAAGNGLKSAVLTACCDGWSCSHGLAHEEM